MMVKETQEMFKNLQIEQENIKVLQDLPKHQILAYFEELVRISEQFEMIEQTGNEKKVLSILVRWIGFDAQVNQNQE